MNTRTSLLLLGILLAVAVNGAAQPILTCQPHNQTAIAGSNVTFTVCATGTEPLSYQWRSHLTATSFTNIPWGTEATLVLTNVQPITRRFGVVVTDAGGLSVTSSPLVTLTVLVPPSFTNQPVSQLAEVGDTVTLTAVATGTIPLAYQWRLNGTNLAGKTSTNLVLTNVRFTNAGGYTLVVTNIVGATTSQVATLTVLPAAFTKITTGSIVNDGGYSFGCAWGDYNNDGWVDLFVANDYLVNGNRVENAVANNFLYRNNGNGTFMRITNVVAAQSTLWSISGAWGDYDNDGNLDLFVGNPGHPNSLYRNAGNGSFTKVTTGPIATDVQYSHAGVWGDVNNDGWLDLFVANFAARTDGVPRENVLYRSDVNGGFNRFSFGPKTLETGQSWNAAWGDFDNDGWLDLFVPHGGTALAGQRSRIYRNDQTGVLSLLSNSVVSIDLANAAGCAWGDFNNDGYLDLFVAHFYGQNNALYQNNGDGSFTAITNSVVTLDGGTSVGGAWADYDNDGWLDLFVSNLGPVDATNFVSIRAENNFLYHNNGDGTFTKVTSGRVVNDLGYSTGCAWADYDNDGFLDLFVANGWETQSENNFLYHNNGNSNNWITIRLVGTVSNRSAIGAKVRVLANIGGRIFWQLREISGGSNYGSQNDMRPSFGLGDANNIDTLRIEWPSGTVQELHNVSPKQFLTVTEAPRLEAMDRPKDNSFQLQMTGWAGLTFAIDTSSNVTDWTTWRVVTATNRTTQIDAPGLLEPSRFYRALPAN